MDILAARAPTPESRAWARDEAARKKHAAEAVKAFRTLTVAVAPMAEEAKAAFPGKDEQSLDRQGRAFVKLARENEDVQQYRADACAPALFSSHETLLLTDVP